jgi:hypothetical protein
MKASRLLPPEKSGDDVIIGSDRDPTVLRSSLAAV